MITSKTLKLSLKSLKDFAKKRLPDEVLRELDDTRRMPARNRPSYVQPGQAGHSTPVHSRRVRGHGRRSLRCVLRLRRNGAHRPGRRHRRAGHVPGQRSDHCRRHSGAKETLADAHCGRGIAVRLRRHGAGSGQRFGRASHHGGPGHRKRPRRRLQNQRQQAMDQQWRNR